ncbi:MAG TPA: hypothetical protein VEN29_13405 [Casimicrobiaceae bacterium]|nr:hypothetical protein [Casimicrobiaceae bacterium]
MSKRSWLFGTIAASAWHVAALLLAIGTLVPGTSFAQELSDEWKFGAFLYGYLPQIKGSTTFPAGITANISVSPNQLISNLKFTFMGSLAAQKGHWGLFTDVLYVDVGGSKSGARDLRIGDITIPAGITADADLGIKSTLWTLGGSYRVVASPETTFDVLAGARLLDLKENLGWQFNADIGPFVGPGRQGSSEVSANKWDAIIGVKGRFAFGDNHEWFMPYYLDVGTGQTQLTWQAIAGLGYAFSWGDVIALWRYIDYHFKSTDAFGSLSLNGPAIGVAFHW